MPDNVKAIVFDMDGTLVDSMWMWDEIDDEFLALFQKDKPKELHNEIEGMGFKEAAVYFKEQFAIPITTDEIKQIWNEMAYGKYMTKVPLKDGVPEFLSLVRKKEIPMAVATSNSHFLTDQVFEKLGVRDFFPVIVTAEDVPHSKPEPDVYLQAAKLLQVPPEECLVFEDTPAGITAAKRAGMRVIAVDDALTKEQEDEKRQLADGYILSFSDLIKGR